MKNAIYLVETEPSEWDFFREKLADFSVRCVDELREVEADAEAVSVFVHSPIGAEFLDAHPSVKLIYDHIDVAGCARRDVTVCNVSSVDENTVAEHTLALRGEALRLAKPHESTAEALESSVVTAAEIVAPGEVKPPKPRETETSIAARLRTRGCPVCDYLGDIAFNFFAKKQYALYLDEKAQSAFAATRGFVRSTCGNCTPCLCRAANRSASRGWSSKLRGFSRNRARRRD